MTSHSLTPARRGFTLVEMLVVIAIIAVLAGLLIPVLAGAVNTARRGAMVAEIANLTRGIEAYKDKHGDYPPGFRSKDVFTAHVRRCYPRCDPNHFQAVCDQMWGNGATNFDNPKMDEGEALVFWLSQVDDDKRYPFKYILGNTPNVREPIFDFAQTRLISDDTDGVSPPYNSYKPSYAGDSCYILIDSRAYGYHTTSGKPTAQAESGNHGSVRPYGADTPPNTAMNARTFQIICAGQDGEFGADVGATTYKLYPGGKNYQTGDEDNLTNFSEGQRLIDRVP